jgi:hypothetical protein
MLSVAQVCDLQPGDENNATWINPGFTGVVRSITAKKTKAGKNFWPCTIADVTGPETIEVSFFTAPKFSEGDVIDIHGKGLRRTEYNGSAQAAIGRETEITVVGRSAHEPEQKERAAAGQPAVNGQPQHIQGQTVGMAIKEALAILAKGNDAKLHTPEFWAQVHQLASDIIRVSQLLEKGKLAPSARDRMNPPQQPPPDRSAPPAPKAKPAASTQPEEEDVPF